MNVIVVKMSVSKVKSPKIPAAMNEKQRNLVELMVKSKPSARV